MCNGELMAIAEAGVWVNESLSSPMELIFSRRGTALGKALRICPSRTSHLAEFPSPQWQVPFEPCEWSVSRHRLS